MARKRKKKPNILLPIAIVLFITAVTMVLMVFGRNKYPDTINKGVTINNVDVGGMTVQQAKVLLTKEFNSQFDNKQIKMVYGKRKFSIDYKSLKAHYDIDSAINTAYAYAKKDGLIDNVLKNIGIKSSKYSVAMNYSADTSIVNKKVRRIARKLDIDPKDASIKFNGKEFKIISEEAGKAVNQKKLISLIKAEIADKDDNTIDIPVDSVSAHIKASMLSTVKTPISSFTTHFRSSDVSRSSNIRIAASAVDGTVVMPGEVFSMNKAVGPRVASKGYKEAHVIVNGELTNGMAGGICQATTTVYNAALLANFDIVERKNHGLRVAYVKPGMDATISGDYIDMKFKNTNKTPIYIHTIIKNGAVTVTIYGTNEHPGQTVKLDSTVLARINPPNPVYLYDPTLKAGVHIYESNPIGGSRTISYRRVYQNGKLIKTEVLSKDKYKASAARVRVGTRKVN